MPTFDDSLTKVMFRKTPRGEILGLLPTEPGDKSGETVICYELVPKQGLVKTSVRFRYTVRATKPAELADYSALLSALGDIGLAVYVAERVNARDHALRYEESQYEPYQN